MRASPIRSLLVLLTVTILLAGCGSAGPSQMPLNPGLRRDSIAIVDTEELEIRVGPGADYRLVGRLSRGDRLFVQHTAGGWALVQAAGSEHLSGWLSLAGPDGGPSIAAARLDCPPPPYDLEGIASQKPEERLACYGDRTISMTAAAIDSYHSDGFWFNDPSWLYDPAYPCRFGPDSDGPWLDVAFAPDSGLECPGPLSPEGRFRITGHFDDPAAATCSSYLEDMDNTTTYTPAYESVFRCRVQFVVTAFVDLDLATPTPVPPSADPLFDQLVVTVTSDLRVRSQPWVGDDSIKYEPLLPVGTELMVLDGPMSGSGYVWYQVRPVSFSGLEQPGYGWVAMAGKDGQPWIALADAPIAGIELAKATVPRSTADPAAAKAAAASINAFGLDLLRDMLADGTLQADQNAVISPTSIALALAMARAGAKGETAAEMDRVLHTGGWDALGPGLNALEQILASHDATWSEDEYDWSEGEGREVKITHELAVRIANAAFAQRDWEIEQAYLERIGSTFGAGVRLLDYRSDPEAARKLINAWVSAQTKERIPELIPRDVIQALTRLVLVNAIYLKANWAREFEPDRTEPAPFGRLDGSKVGVPTMHLWSEQDIPYARGNGWQAIELRYRGPTDATTWQYTTPLAMTLILPADIASFEASLTAGQLARITSTLDAQRARLQEVTDDGYCGTYPYNVELFMPRFSIDTKARLKDVLAAAGMPLAFDQEDADFTGIYDPADEPGGLYIAEVIHQANIDTDEEGSEAAAATAVVMDTGGCTGPMAAKTVTMRLDRPFLFVLRDVETGAALFVGRVVDPSVGRP